MNPTPQQIAILEKIFDSISDRFAHMSEIDGLLKELEPAGLRLLRINLDFLAEPVATPDRPPADDEAWLKSMRIVPSLEVDRGT